jgi:hypothetical protein
VIAVGVGNQDEVRLGQAVDLGRFRRIDIDHLAAGFDHQAGVVNRRDFDRAGRGIERLRRLPSLRHYR